MASRIGALDYGVVNAALAWVTVAALALAAAERALAGELLWTGLALTVVAVAVGPPAFARRATEMVAWEVLAFAALPVVARSFGFAVGAAAYLAVAALALLVAAELDEFTDVEMTPRFAVAFVVIVTMGVAGLWVIARYASDVYLGTTTITGQTAVMWDLVAATAVGVVAGLAFELYVRRLSPRHSLAGDPPEGVR